MARFSKPPLASLEHCLVTASVKRRQSGCRVAMLIQPRNFTESQRPTQFIHAEGNIMICVMRVYRGFGGVVEPIMYHNDRSVNRGEPDVSCNQQVRCTTITWRKPKG